ncbi:DUF2071 domain-containing protein [soil metagenome]
MAGVIDRRLLVNYRVDPDVARGLIPDGLRPLLVDGNAVAGICLLRLDQLRPAGLPAAIGLRSENVAHRIAVEWDTPDGMRTGVFIPRRDSGSRVNVAVGGRLFPGPHGRARFEVNETPDQLTVSFRNRDDGATARVEVKVATELRGSHLFRDLATASDFFRSGSIGWSPRRRGPRLDGLELRTSAWTMEPTDIVSVSSSFFEGGPVPASAAQLDCVLLMRRVPVTWLDAGGQFAASAA